MTVTLDLSPDKEHRLREQARQAGLPLDEFLVRAVDHWTSPPDAALPARDAEETAEQRAERFLRWADSHDRTKPIIPLETLDREQFYEERG
jgi:hypothetical protein